MLSSTVVRVSLVGATGTTPLTRDLNLFDLIGILTTAIHVSLLMFVSGAFIGLVF